MIMFQRASLVIFLVQYDTVSSQPVSDGQCLFWPLSELPQQHLSLRSVQPRHGSQLWAGPGPSQCGQTEKISGLSSFFLVPSALNILPLRRSPSSRSTSRSVLTSRRIVWKPKRRRSLTTRREFSPCRPGSPCRCPGTTRTPAWPGHTNCERR